MMGYGYWGGCLRGAGRGSYGGWMHGGLPIIGGILWLLIVIGIVALIVYAVRRPAVGAVTTVGAATVAAPTTPSALDVVRERYARGEIDRDEYKRLTEDLK